MLRLVSQFDTVQMRASVATPTCMACCSCCCCCIVTTLASSILTSRSMGRLAADENLTMNIAQTSEPDHNPESGKNTDQEETQVKIATPKYKHSKLKLQIYGFFFLPMVIASSILTVIILSGIRLLSGITLISPLVIFALGLYAIHSTYGLKTSTAVRIFIYTIVAMVVEFFAGAYIILKFL